MLTVSYDIGCEVIQCGAPSVRQRILLYLAFCAIMAISRQKEARSRHYAILRFIWWLQFQGFFMVHINKRLRNSQIHCLVWCRGPTSLDTVSIMSSKCLIFGCGPVSPIAWSEDWTSSLVHNNRLCVRYRTMKASYRTTSDLLQNTTRYWLSWLRQCHCKWSLQILQTSWKGNQAMTTSWCLVWFIGHGHQGPPWKLLEQQTWDVSPMDAGSTSNHHGGIVGLAKVKLLTLRARGSTLVVRIWCP